MIYVVGLGPGRKEEMTGHALAALERCDTILGYRAYIDLCLLYTSDAADEL